MKNIYGPLRKGYGDWRIRTNYEVDKLTNGVNVVIYKSTNIEHKVGHVRMDDKRVVKNITDWKTMGKKAKVKPRKR